MKTDYLDLKDYNITFKQLISGPAPVGRILHYLILTGKGVLRHKNGNRVLLNDNIASAWCSEFMVGLGLVYYDETSSSDVYDLHLTDNGKKLFECIKDFEGSFDENVNPNQCKKQLINYSKQAYDLFFNIFKSSPVCLNLCIYINNASTNEFLKSDFKDDYFECFKLLYEGGTYNRAARTTTAANRVPSLIQLCQFFECVDEVNDKIVFDINKLSSFDSEIQFIPITQEIIVKLNTEHEYIEKLSSELIAKYGIDGTVVREILTRNSAVQDLFRNNLLAKYGCKCAICNKTIETVMVASHIKPSADDNVVEKADCENGLLLCALHDKLFDRYLISFDFNTGELLYSSVLEESLADYQLYKGMKLEEKFLTLERKEYLLIHNLAFYERNK